MNPTAVTKLPLAGMLNTRGMENFANISLYLGISETVRDRSMVNELLWNTNRDSVMADRSVPVPMTLNELERRGAKGQTFPKDLHNYVPTV